MKILAVYAVLAIGVFLVAMADAQGASTGVLVPANPLGLPDPPLGPKQIPVQPSRFTACPSRAYIQSFQIGVSHTNLDLDFGDGLITDFLGSLSATCSDGSHLATVRDSFGYDSSCQAVRANATVSLGSPTSYNDTQDQEGDGSGFSSVYYSSGTWMDSLLGIGGPGGSSGSAECPNGYTISGFTAAPSCYGITHLQFICSPSSAPSP